MSTLGKHRFFAPCPAGVEPLLADEFRRIGVRGVRPQRSGALFTGTVADGLRVLAWTRLASRVLLTLAEVDASSADAFYQGVHDLTWEDHVRAGGTIAVDAGGTNDALRNTQFTAVRAKDAIADRFRERFGRRPSVDVRNPDLRINVAVRQNKATISLDLAGQPLHRRGYREAGVQVAAPMKETLAAAVLESAGWREIAADGGAFVDPMCGSGTLAVEAALAAADVAPALVRSAHPVERWLGFDGSVWSSVMHDAEQRRAQGLSGLVPISASDTDARSVSIARGCVARAGLQGKVRIEQAGLDRLAPPRPGGSGLVATNPPWGERLGEPEELQRLYMLLRERLVPAYAGWKLAVVSPDPALEAGLSMSSEWSRTLGSGKGAATVTLFALSTAAEESAPRAPRAAGKTVGKPGGKTRREAPSHVVDATPFANRLAKMARHYGKWARRNSVTCYRVYDADLPDFSFAVDIYEGAGADEGGRWAHVSEYAAPVEIEVAKAEARLESALAVIPETLGVDPDRVHVKRRQRQRGSAQYQRLSKSGAVATVAENNLLFEVNFSDYLDTGLFLDHRDTRVWLREQSAGQRFLNLFAYTGTATVYAADGGCSASTTVDLSATYLAWAERNLALNGLESDAHSLIQADVLDWVDTAASLGERYGLVFCDPPTFSNSKRMDGTWDVQRDHARLLVAVSQLMTEDGQLVFSCNRRSFALDEAALVRAGLTTEDITARTIPRDFERNPRVHACWIIRRT